MTDKDLILHTIFGTNVVVVEDESEIPTSVMQAIDSGSESEAVFVPGGRAYRVGEYVVLQVIVPGEGIRITALCFSNDAKASDALRRIRV